MIYASVKVFITFLLQSYCKAVNRCQQYDGVYGIT